MARGRRGRSGDEGIMWPGYVDVMSTLLMVVTFLLSIFMLSQYYVSQQASGKDDALRRLNRQIAQLTELLSLEKGKGQTVVDELSALTASLASLKAENARLSGALAGIGDGGNGRVNSLTGEDNFLREAQLEYLFCTVLSARDPDGNFHHMKSFYWNVRWQARFLPHDFDRPQGNWFVNTISAGQGAATSGIIEGEPTDKRFKDILTDASVSGCNALVPLYAPAPDGVLPPGHPCRRESRVWHTFDVRV